MAKPKQLTCHYLTDRLLTLELASLNWIGLNPYFNFKRYLHRGSLKKKHKCNTEITQKVL